MKKNTREVTFGGVSIGGGNDILIQSMTNTDTVDVQKTLEQIDILTKAGCEAIRCAFYNADCAMAFREIKQNIRIPLIADVHFDARLAVLAIENGADKVRINPGNIGGDKEVAKVVECAKHNGAAIRIGVNAGSLEKELLKKYGGPIPIALAESAMNSVRFVYDMDFHDVVVSIKSSSVPVCVEACRIFSDACEAPQHIGITEAGTYHNALIKSAVGLGALLMDGIGDTLRVSITGCITEEIDVARRILQSAGLRTFYPEVISCPTCARTKINVAELSTKVEQILTEMDKPIIAAVMGCIVNGPGEAKNADIGIAGGDGKAALFSKGTLVGTYKESEILTVFKNYIDNNF